jgi:hypothetical protein
VRRETDHSGDTCATKGCVTEVVFEDETGVQHECKVCGAEIVEDHPPADDTDDGPPYVTKGGRVLDAGDLDDLADEAEAGYDISRLTSRQKDET